MRLNLSNCKLLNLKPKIYYLEIFRLEFENAIVITKISVLEFVLLKSLFQKKKSLKFRPKIPYLAVFGLEF